MSRFLFCSLLFVSFFVILPLWASCDVNCEHPSTLVGWSKDGKIWATLHDCDEAPDLRPATLGRLDMKKSVLVVQDAKNILHIVRTQNCIPRGLDIKQISNTEIETKEGQKIPTIVISSDPKNSTEKRSPIERIDISNQKGLQQYHLQPVQATWKLAFQEKFFLHPKKKRVVYFRKGEETKLPEKQSYPAWMVDWVTSNLKQPPKDKSDLFGEKNQTIACSAVELSSKDQVTSFTLLESCKKSNKPYDDGAAQKFSFVGGFLHPSGAILLKFSYQAVGLVEGSLFSYVSRS